VEIVVTLSHEFWRDRRVFLTGHTGFKGAWASLMLNALGAKVCGVALAPEAGPNIYELAQLADRIESHVLDIRDGDRLKGVVSSFKPDIIIHMAAQSLVRASYASPVETYETNVMGTINVLEAARGISSVGAIVVVSSDKCYLNREWLWPYREDEALGGHDPYSSSKACTEIVAASWRQSFFSDGGAAIASARAGNVIGGGDWAVDRVIPDCVRAFTKGVPVAIRNPQAVRPWQHVLEPVTGYLMLAERLIREPAQFSEAWNFGPNEADTSTVAHVVKTLIRHWGTGANWTSPPGAHPHEAHTLRIDSTKARVRLGWRSLLPLDEAVAWTAEWYRDWASGTNVETLCGKQIEKYLSLAAMSK
jgi:CDP-glucose 4,6-dehydratase